MASAQQTSSIIIASAQLPSLMHPIDLFKMTNFIIFMFVNQFAFDQHICFEFTSANWFRFAWIGPPCTLRSTVTTALHPLTSKQREEAAAGSPTCGLYRLKVCCAFILHTTTRSHGSNNLGGNAGGDVILF